MENKTSQTKEKEVKEKVSILHKEIIEDFKLGRYYGLDQKIRHIQKTVSLGIRI